MGPSEKNCGTPAVPGDIFHSSFLKIPDFKKFLKNPHIAIPVLPAERCFGDRALCACGRMPMGCEACHTVLCQCKACASTKR